MPDKSGQPYLQIRDADAGTVRLIWQDPPTTPPLTEDPLARALAAEEALHRLCRRLLLHATEPRLPRRIGVASAQALDER